MSQAHAITLATRDGQSISFSSQDGQYLLDAAEAAGITLPSVCRNGQCGACKGTCSNGDYDLVDVPEDVLGQQQRASGDILFCRTRANSDLAVSVGADLAQLAMGPAPRHPAILEANDDIGGQVRRVKLLMQPDDAGNPFPAFEPGQFIEVNIPGTETWRAYSIASAPNWTGEVELLIRLQPKGQFSEWLRTEASLGETVSTRGPKGHFTLQPGGLNPRYYICGGTGLAPMMSMINQAIEFQDGTPSHLFFGVNTEDDLFCEAEIAEARDMSPALTTEICVAAASKAWTGFSGTPLDAARARWREDLSAGIQPDLYVCGPPGLIDATLQAAADDGIPASQVFAEKFLPT